MRNKRAFSDSFDYIQEFCVKNDIHLLTTVDEYQELLKIDFPSNVRLSFKCTCGEIYTTTFYVIKKGLGRHCKKCVNIKRTKENSFEEDYIKEILKSKELTLMSKYKKASSKIIVKDNLGYLYSIVISQIYKNKLKFVHTNNPYSIHNIKNFIKINNLKYELLDTKYISNNQNLKLRCLNEGCGYEFEATWSSLKNKISCHYCCHQKARKDNNLGYLFPHLLQEWDFDKNIVSPFEILPYSDRVVWWLCEKGHSYSSATKTKTIHGASCPICSGSNGEKIIKKYLDDNNINHKSQQTFDDLIVVNKLRFDFSILDNDDNVIGLIEFQGKQHYEPIEHFGGEETFVKQQHRDKLKVDYCKNKEIPLLIIKYDEIKNINDILNEVFINGYFE